VVSRAVAPLKELWSWSKPLLKNGSYKMDGDNGEETVFKSGLICLKGGDLKAEIAESATHPKRIEISSLFEEEYFKEKFLLYVKG
jgi:16S rRNA (guanine527-N7)-methyltransferase